jgi:glycosyltransferase involved in cell wall biosynthesis
MTPGQAATVSVVIAAYNEERHIGALLSSLEEQTLGPTEVIVCDDGSADATADAAAVAGSRVLRLPHRGPAVARNAGAEASVGEILVFLDADMECAPQFVERLVMPIAAGEATGTFTREIFLANRDNRWARAYAALRWSPEDRLLPANFPNQWEAFRAIRRDAFIDAGGYDDVGYGEDLTLAEKVGELALAAPGAVCFHNHPDSPGEVFENGRWVGRGESIRTLAHPWWTHSPPRVLAIGLAQVARGKTPWVLPGRVIYHAGVLVGLAQSSLRPERHWK